MRAPSLVSYLASSRNASKARERICFRKSDVFAAINGLHVSSHVTWTSEARRSRCALPLRAAEAFYAKPSVACRNPPFAFAAPRPAWRPAAARRSTPRRPCSGPKTIQIQRFRERLGCRHSRIAR